MTYDFTTLYDRRGRDAVALDAQAMTGAAYVEPEPGFDLIPMAVADMNFPFVTTITEAIVERAQHPFFGYFEPRDEYFDAIITWQRERNGVEGLAREHIGYENGVLGGVVSALRAFAQPGDAVLVHSPTYIGFTSAIENAGFKIVLSPLVQDAQGIWRMDYDDMERKLAEHRIHAAVFCSPHNPTGRVWERAELERAMAIYEQYDCVVISDEIWSDLTLPGHTHIPLQSVSEDARNRTIALYAPSKTFNIAGLVGSYHIIYNRYLRERVEAAASKPHYSEMNLLSMYALIGAYRPEGQVWVDELRDVLGENVTWACRYIAEHFEGVRVIPPEGTYLLFVDCTAWCERAGRSIDWIVREAVRHGVIVQDGRPFHGTCHLRMNLALPKTRVEEAFRRLDRYVFNAEEAS